MRCAGRQEDKGHWNQTPHRYALGTGFRVNDNSSSTWGGTDRNAPKAAVRFLVKGMKLFGSEFLELSREYAEEMRENLQDADLSLKSPRAAEGAALAMMAAMERRVLRGRQ